VPGVSKNMRSLSIYTLVAVFLPRLLAQHGYTPGDVQEGEGLFIENCAICHGPEGDAVPGVELARGKFKHASSDEELSQIIKNGIPGTAMPPGNFHEHQLTALVAYLHSMSAAPADTVVLGNAARGKTTFEGKGECLRCHRADGTGSYFGPDLTDIGVKRRAAQLERSILDPDAEILPQNRFIPRSDAGQQGGSWKTSQPGYLYCTTHGFAPATTIVCEGEPEGVWLSRQIPDAIL
jgi:mono/diheme cytochrome c family protein